ncbi:hypothetical protein CY34DRAFT_812632 [Suillus luteus UH-Slu-Lm8-n1]|uniref:Uncharacterized protein n=1 Tax=Suillus luteus UH-Slu-Lm8-n1 TaxID=930992 RepID=A0A0D0AKM2_9AGAM|nr:hypothetical protein CY34DRAFT_812632 [Suillus luteus UH-Slu-Lm8-n1]
MPRFRETTSLTPQIDRDFYYADSTLLEPIIGARLYRRLLPTSTHASCTQYPLT